MTRNNEETRQLNTIDGFGRSEKNENEGILSPNTYQMRPKLSETFKTNEIKRLVHRILVNQLRGKSYSPEEAKILTVDISEEVNRAVRELNMRRYKHIVQVILGQESGAGCRYVTRCRWDAECDNQTSDVYSNSSLFCVCTVFGIYLY